ncbi:MAG TPA: phosphatidate cytidylyltransferase [Anaerolineaceae bacterium]|nr:phosphatidate cytidylyltransferase [Longilinea sp.]HOD43762.1 phosphatidate cytidylyltransferase [Anaerolineaceae bacterium]HQP60765.1 phosphatidate cytidylyltransferase [Anaerolineaceae bacterium]
MLRERLVVAIILIPAGIGFIAAGGWYFTLFITAILCVAAWEFGQIFQSGGHKPATFLLIAGVGILVISRKIFTIEISGAVLAGLILMVTAWHTLAYEKGRDAAATDFVVTLGGLLYLGWLGGYFVSLREISGGEWWLLVMILSIAIGDALAYSIGRRWGKHKMAHRVSPNKSWEGWIAGAVGSALGGWLLAALWNLVYPTMQPIHGLISGTVMGILAPLGDFGESMLKRQFGVKDSGRLFPGHGGVMDRIDSWLWAAVIGYYLVTWFLFPI